MLIPYQYFNYYILNENNKNKFNNYIYVMSLDTFVNTVLNVSYQGFLDEIYYYESIKKDGFNWNMKQQKFNNLQWLKKKQIDMNHLVISFKLFSWKKDENNNIKWNILYVIHLTHIQAIILKKLSYNIDDFPILFNIKTEGQLLSYNEMFYNYNNNNKVTSFKIFHTLVPQSNIKNFNKYPFNINTK